MTTAAPTLMTGEEFIRLDGHELMSLVDGVPVVEETERSLRHGQVCATVGGELFDFVKANRLGRVCSNNTSIRLKRNPDTVYGPDLCYFSRGRMPKGSEPDGVCDFIPELVVEVWVGTPPPPLSLRDSATPPQRGGVGVLDFSAGAELQTTPTPPRWGGVARGNAVLPAGEGSVFLRPTELLAKVSLYLNAGVTAAVVVVPDDETATVYRLNEFHQTFHDNDVLELPDVLPGFALPLQRLFE